MPPVCMRQWLARLVLREECFWQVLRDKRAFIQAANSRFFPSVVAGTIGFSRYRHRFFGGVALAWHAILGTTFSVLAIVDGWDARAACLTVASVTSACISKSLANPILQADLIQTTGLSEWIVLRAHPVTLLFCDP